MAKKFFSLPFLQVIICINCRKQILNSVRKDLAFSPGVSLILADEWYEQKGGSLFVSLLFPLTGKRNGSGARKGDCYTERRWQLHLQLQFKATHGSRRSWKCKLPQQAQILWSEDLDSEGILHTATSEKVSQD